jgi:5-methylcytosine-specific restriction endonuclease McrA
MVCALYDVEWSSRTTIGRDTPAPSATVKHGRNPAVSGLIMQSSSCLVETANSKRGRILQKRTLGAYCAMMKRKRLKNITRTCLRCQKQISKFEFKRFNGQCSLCYGKSASESIDGLSARQIAYQAYLESHHWKILRAKILKFYGCRCCVCNSGFQVDVHHRTYERLGMELDTDLIVLCRQCHSTFHSKSLSAR